MIRAATALALSMAVSSTALAGQCPWAGAESLVVRATMTRVWVNDTPYNVKGFYARTQFMETLTACEATDAARAFERWRAHRRYTNTLFGVGFLFWPTWLAAPVTAVMAGEYKWEMIDALQAMKPPSGGVAVATPVNGQPAPTPPTAGETPFRSAAWGMTMAQVRAVETAHFHSEDADRLFFEDEVAGLQSMMMYQFAQGRLVMGKYVSVEEHSNPIDHITDFHTLQEALTAKYGDPAENEEVWRGETYREQPDQAGAAVASGELVYYARWDTPETEIVLALLGDNGDVTLAIEYHSKELGDLAEEVREKGMLDGL